MTLLQMHRRKQTISLWCRRWWSNRPYVFPPLHEQNPCRITGCFERTIMTELTKLTIAQIRAGLSAKDFTALELTEAYLGAINEANDKLNAYVAVTADKAREMAKASDKRLAHDGARPLEGVPIGVKDLFATEGVHTQAASHILDGFKP